jgi:hypothetical protein
MRRRLKIYPANRGLCNQYQYAQLIIQHNLRTFYEEHVFAGCLVAGTERFSIGSEQSGPE